ncbi:MAG: PHP domain-containing protein [Clostridia bacterium]|nr:PHP domain-containing protein [Clostridia bacterium]
MGGVIIIKYDLHVHSSDSDGKYNKIEILEKAEEKKIELIAFCDHNTLGKYSVEEIKRIYYEKNKKECNTIIIPSIEISAGSNKYKGIHILGYGIKDFKLINRCLEDIDYRNLNNIKRQIELINKNFNIQISYEEVKKTVKKEIITEIDIETVLMKLGYIQNKKDMYKYTNRNSLSHVDKYKLEDKETIRVIKEAGGIAVLAHPIELKIKENNTNLGDGVQYEKYIRYLKSVGLDGIETHTLKHNEKQQEKYYNISKKYGLLATAGSDFHDETRTPILGVSYNPDFFLKPIMKELIERGRIKDNERDYRD